MVKLLTPRDGATPKVTRSFTPSNARPPEPVGGFVALPLMTESDAPKTTSELS